ncbi:MAG: 50S ribosomal protein L22 [Candidatus Staskawiczbacteria bacterium]|nr:50S ribosomal protein L22 [Candidatus Staskawiczbacteria bacterium]MBI3337581.1 50S ribosomal protein L22 [Candidatus Staskawiczbacteria bacterium]
MEITVKLNHLRVTARKAREVVDLIRGKTAVDAKVLLSFATRKSATPILKLLNSATASAKHDFQIGEENLYVSKTTVDEGPTLKRWHAMSRGRAYPIMKRSAHITIVLSEIRPVKEGPANPPSGGKKLTETKTETTYKKQKKSVKKKIKTKK